MLYCHLLWFIGNIPFLFFHSGNLRCTAKGALGPGTRGACEVHLWGHLSSENFHRPVQCTQTRIDSETIMNRLEEGALGNPVLAGKPRSPAPMVLLVSPSKPGDEAVIDSQRTHFRNGSLLRECREAEQYFLLVGETQ